jgi:formylglycine-generating enzyme required for sulfatase activity
MEFAYAPAGNFQMGSEQLDWEKPVHQVTIANGFYMGRYEVSEAQWKKVMGNDHQLFRNSGENYPVESVTWDDAQEFIKRLNAANDGYTYRLPSEAEWEHACRAGTTGDQAGDVNSMAWTHENSNDKLHPVGQKKPNAWGLYDMLGNVDEWVMDTYHENYNGAPTDGSAWTSGGDTNKRVVRGGSEFDSADHLRPSIRKSNEVTSGSGFRVVAVPQSK